MINGYPYMAIMVTGVLHSLLGTTCGICSVIGMFGVTYQTRQLRTYCAVALFTSNMVLMVGSIGTSAGRMKHTEHRLRKLKLGYMVLSILSACIFSVVGNAMFLSLAVVANHFHEGLERFVLIGRVGTIAMCLEFVLAIVSSSICCCCATINVQNQQNTTMIVQVPQGQPYPMIQYAAPPGQPYGASSGQQYGAPPGQPYPMVQYQLAPGQPYPMMPNQQPPPPSYEAVDSVKYV